MWISIAAFNIALSTFAAVAFNFSTPSCMLSGCWGMAASPRWPTLAALQDGSRRAKPLQDTDPSRDPTHLDPINLPISTPASTSSLISTSSPSHLHPALSPHPRLHPSHPHTLSTRKPISAPTPIPNFQL